MSPKRKNSNAPFIEYVFLLQWEGEIILQFGTFNETLDYIWIMIVPKIKKETIFYPTIQVLSSSSLVILVTTADASDE